MKRPKKERYLILSDFHVPDHDIKIFDLILRFISFYQPDYIDILGDFVNFTKISKYDQDPYYKTDLADEIEEGRGILRQIVKTAHSANPRVEITWVEGNHEQRLTKFLGKNASQLAGLTSDEEFIVSVPHLFECKKLGVKWVNSDRIIQRHGVSFFHGLSVRVKSGFSAHANIDKFGTSGFTGHCFDDKTEILTSKGWKKHTELSKGTEVLTLNRDIGELEWNKVQEVFKYNKYKELLEVSGFGLNLALTPDHGMVVRKPGKRNKDWVEKKAYEVATSRYEIPLSGFHRDVSIPLDTSWVSLLAWIVTEGNISLKENGSIDGIRIAQSDTPKGTILRLEKTLLDCGIDYSKIKRYDANTTKHGQHRNYDAYRYGLKNAQLIFDKVSSYITEKKELKNSLLQMSADQCEVFLKTYIDADGCKNSSALYSYQLASNKPHDIDILQALAAKSGYRSTVSTNNGMVYLTINSRGFVRVNKENWKTIPYNGVTWCVSVPNHTLVVRRNGKTAITMNTHRMALVTRTQLGSTKFWVETGCLCNKITTPTYVVSPDWTQGFAVAEYNHETRQFYPQVIPIINNSFVFNQKLFN